MPKYVIERDIPAGSMFEVATRLSRHGVVRLAEDENVIAEHALTGSRADGVELAAATVDPTTAEAA